MRKVQLGRSGVAVTELFFGAGGIGGIGSSLATVGKGLPLAQGLERLNEAYDLGIRVVDTANSYGGGRSEEAVGPGLGEREPEDVLGGAKAGGAGGAGQGRVHLVGAAASPPPAG